MQTQPEFYALEFFSDANFWTVGDASTRRTFLMPLSNPAEFLAFGVLSPSNELIFVARGRVIDHLGPFITRMKQAGAKVELYSRPPLPGHVINEYTKGSGHEQKETDSPPPAPDAMGKVILSGSTTQQSLSTSTMLWGNVNGPEKRVVKMPIPNLVDECLAIGLVKVDPVSPTWLEYKELVAFVVRMKASELGTEFRDAATAEMIPVDMDAPQTLVNYMNASFPPTLTGASQGSGVKSNSVLIA